MKRMLFNATQAEELRVAIVDGQTLLDLDIETLGKEQRKGNIYKGVITRIEPSLEACFVDYGTDRHGFLPFKEVSRSYFQDYEGGRARIQDVLKEGMEVIVQVEKDERGNKGAALTTFISLAGRYLVLMPNNPRGGGVSRRIEGEERQELKDAMAQLDVPRGMSLIARTAGIGRSVEELQWDFNYLLQLWHAIEEAGNAHHEPYLLFMESSLLIRAIRDYYRPDIGEILVDNQEVHEQISEFMSYVMPNNVGRLKLYQDHTPLFSRFQIEHQIESAFSRSVSLPSGGAIVIDHTEALVSIDVNSARATRGNDIEDTAFKTNMEAAEEVARQMRLRDLGGLVVIDFIDMENPKHQRDVETVLRDALKKDRARVQMGKLSRFGLLELSRQRLKPALGESSHVACPRCAGTGVIRGIESTALHVLRIIQEEAMKDNTGEVHAQVPVDVATFLLNEKRAELFGLEERLDVSVMLIPNTHLENPHYEITRVRIDDVDDEAGPSYKRVEVPEDNEESKPFGSEKAKAARPEPAVKGVKHTQPAPTVEAPAQASWWDKFKSWLGGLFSPAAQAEEAPRPAAKKRSEGQGANRRQQNRRQTPRRSQAKRQEGARAEIDDKLALKAQAEEGGKAETKPAVREERDSRNARRERNRPNRQEARSRTAAEDVAETAAAAAAAAPLAAAGRESGKNSRNAGAAREARAAMPVMPSETAPPEQPALPAAAEGAEVQTPVQAGAEAAAGKQPEAKQNRSRREREERGERNRNRDQRDRRGNGKKRHIPSAEKIEHYLSIAEVGEKVRFAAAHVLGEAVVQAPLSVSVAMSDDRVDGADQSAPLVVVVPEMAHVAETVGFAPDAEQNPQAAANEQAAAGEPVSGAFVGKTEQAATAADAAEVAESVSDASVAGGAERGGAEAVHPESGTVQTAPDAGKTETVTAPSAPALVQVHTDPAELAAAAAVDPLPAAVGLRRSDMPKNTAAAAEQVRMVQIETALEP